VLFTGGRDRRLEVTVGPEDHLRVILYGPQDHPRVSRIRRQRGGIPGGKAPGFTENASPRRDHI